MVSAARGRRLRARHRSRVGSRSRRARSLRRRTPFRTAHADKRIGAELLEDPRRRSRRSNETAASRRRSARRSSCSTSGTSGRRPPARGEPRAPARLPRRRRDVRLDPCRRDHPVLVGSPLENVHRALDADDRCRATLDTEFLALHGQLEAALADDVLWERVAHVHVKDYAGALRDALGNAVLPDPGRGRDRLRERLRSAPTARVRGRRSRSRSRPSPRTERRRERLRQAESWLAVAARGCCPFEVPARNDRMRHDTRPGGP